MSLTSSEEIVARRVRGSGWHVYHRGAPDFLLIKRGEKPRFVEVKTGTQKLSPYQEVWRSALTELGARYDTERIPYRQHHAGLFHTSITLPRPIHRAIALYVLAHHGLTLKSLFLKWVKEGMVRDKIPLPKEAK